MTDNAPAPRTGTAQVTVNIIRNQYMPEFRKTSFVKTIGEYWPLRRTVITTTANDNDPSSVSATSARYIQTFKSYRKLKAPSIKDSFPVLLVMHVSFKFIPWDLLESIHKIIGVH